MFDLDLHIVQRYDGHAKLRRLKWIALHHNNVQAAQLAHQCCIEQQNTICYQELYQKFSDNLPAMDTHWMTATETANRHTKEQWLSKLQTAQAHLNKDAIQLAYKNLAEFYLNKTGELSEAFNCALRCKDHAGSKQSQVQATLLALEIGLYQGHYHLVREYVPRLEHNTTTTTNTSSTQESTNNNNNIKRQLFVASGLEKMHTNNYKAAADKFRQATMLATTNSDWDRTVQSPEETALLAGLLTMATEPKRHLSLVEHPSALNRAPIMKDVLSDFYKFADYKQAWTNLEQYVFCMFQYDSFLTGDGGHLQKIQDMIRNQALCLFWKPYHNCPLSKLQENLGSMVQNDPQKMVIQLIESNQFVDTRFDCRTRTLVRVVKQSPEDDLLAGTSRKLHFTTNKVLNDTYSTILTRSCIEQDVNIAAASRRGRRHAAEDDSSDTIIDDFMLDHAAMNPEDRY